ncbi:hypothetical protein C8R43DRAFT_131531 [Mycena crocata]|nr:hypothetical protein C8R43DRAFT_131531 [Mycena crocata]
MRSSARHPTTRDGGGELFLFLLFLCSGAADAGMRVGVDAPSSFVRRYAPSSCCIPFPHPLHPCIPHLRFYFVPSPIHGTLRPVSPPTLILPLPFIPSSLVPFSLCVRILCTNPTLPVHTHPPSSRRRFFGRRSGPGASRLPVSCFSVRRLSHRVSARRCFAVHHGAPRSLHDTMRCDYIRVVLHFAILLSWTRVFSRFASRVAILPVFVEHHRPCTLPGVFAMRPQSPFSRDFSSRYPSPRLALPSTTAFVPYLRTLLRDFPWSADLCVSIPSATLRASTWGDLIAMSLCTFPLSSTVFHRFCLCLSSTLCLSPPSSSPRFASGCVPAPFSSMSIRRYAGARH